MGEKKISKKDTAFRKAISVQERLTLTLRFLASSDSYVSLQYLFKISKQAISCIVPEVFEALVGKLKDYIQARQILLLLLFVVYEISLKLDFNQNFYLNTNFTETLLLKKQAKIFYKHLYILCRRFRSWRNAFCGKTVRQKWVILLTEWCWRSVSRTWRRRVLRTERWKRRVRRNIDTLRVPFRWTTWEVGLRWVNLLEMSTMMMFIKPPICI